MRREIGSALVAFALAGCGTEAEPDVADVVTARVVAEATLGPVRAILRMDPAEPRFGERVRFGLEIDAEAGALLELPEFGMRMGHFRIRDRREEGSVESGRLRYAIQAEAEKTGTNIGRPPPIRFRVTEGEGVGTDRELILEPFEVEVEGLSPDQQPDLADLGTPLPPISLPAGGETGTALWIGGGLALFALIAGLWWWRRHGAVTAVEERVVDPVAEAAAALDALLAARLVEQGRFAEFYVQLTGIVRRFVERTTGVHAPEQTTEEFLREMEGHAAFGDARRRELSAFLAAADLVKFAAQVPTGEEIADSVAAARAFCSLDVRSPEVAA